MFISSIIVIYFLCKLSFEINSYEKLTYNGINYGKKSSNRNN